MFTYSTGDWKDQLVSVSEYSVSSGVATLNGTKTVAYDASGNPTNYKGVALAWEGRKLASYGNYFFFEYDENGLRTSKTFGSSHTEYYYNGSLLMGLKNGSNTLLFSYDASGSVISVNYNGTEYYYLKNAQSDIVGIVDASGTVVANYAYDSWGKVVSCFSPTSNAICTLSPFRYRGYVYDMETGLYYLQSRYYDPSVGRFVSPDVLVSTGQGILGNNMYAYCLNNPVTLKDSSGYSPDYSPAAEFGEWFGEWLKEKIEEYEEDEEVRMNSVTYSPNENGRGAKIIDGYKIIDPLEMYEYLYEHRGDEISGSYTGVVFEWAVHNAAYYFADLFGLEGLKKQTGEVNVGDTIFDDTEHGIFSVGMHVAYYLAVPLFIYKHDQNIDS